MTRTHDLLIMKSVQSLKPPLSSHFAGFPLRKFHINLLSCPFLPAPFFPVVGQDASAQSPVLSGVSMGKQKNFIRLMGRKVRIVNIDEKGKLSVPAKIIERQI